MADTDQEKERKEQNAQAEPGRMSFVSRYLPWILMAVIIVVCAGAGLGLGRLLAGSRDVGLESRDSELDGQVTSAESLISDGAEDSEKVWYYDLDPVVANLNEPGVTRYVRATFMLEVSSEMDKKKGAAFLDEKKPVLINWLTVYLSSLGLEDIRGDKNLRSIQLRVCEAFNEKLFPHSKPLIKRVLIKEFPVQ
ncbi:MAG: flagellar basal body-associated FliL family protein [Sedimentisphaerales bacterium]